MPKTLPRTTARRSIIAVALAVASIAAGGGLMLRRELILQDIERLRVERDAPIGFTADGLAPEQVREEAGRHHQRRC